MHNCGKLMLATRLKKDTDTVLMDLLFEICYIFATLSCIKIGVPPKMGSAQIKALPLLKVLQLKMVCT